MDPEHAAAYVRAYELFQAVQGDRHAEAVAQLPVAAAAAAAAGWSDVSFVLAAAQAVYLTARPPSPGQLRASLAALVAEAETLAQPAFVAMALSLRAVAGLIAGDAATVLADASRAVALLDDRDQPPLDRATAYMVSAGAFNGLRLWELVDELYSEAIVLGPRCPVPVQAPALAVDRVLVRLEWGLALLEVGEQDSAHRQLAQAEEAVPAALEQTLPPLWRSDVEAVRDLVRLLRGQPPGPLLAALAEHRAALVSGGDLEVLPSLDAVRALVLLRCGRLAEAVAAVAGPVVAGSSSSGARSFPVWVRAQVLSAHAPSAAAEAQREHAALVSRMQWDSRLALLAAARVQIAAERRQMDHDRLTRAVHTDALTGLENRRNFDQWLLRRLDPDRVTALLLIDLDGFKAVNDTFGHSEGDEVLRRVGELIRGAVRPGDLALRLGGDEFAVLIEDDRLTPGAAVRRARTLRSAVVTAPWSLLRPGLTLTASVGVVVAGATSEAGARPGALEAAALYRAADRALYLAKRDPDGVVLSSRH